MKIHIEKPPVIAENKRYRGFGMISGNNSSRLLLDYKAQHPEHYNEILELVFGKSHLAVNHLKIEMGSDINSSSGTEPCIMRSEAEEPDITRGAGYILAHDAKKINPELTLDMLFWSEPRWVTDSEDVFGARYRWYRETLVAAYKKYGIKFDYVSVNRNERAIETDWIKYCAKRLKSDHDAPYDFSEIKIVAADEEGSWNICDLMADDSELREAVDVIGSHYTSHSTQNTRLLFDEYGKEVWFSEGSPPMNYSKGASRFDGNGLSGINGALDIANRIIAMYPCGCMSLYEFQPVVSAYYDGVTYGHKQLIDACEPWSGYYRLESGYYAALHFSRFIKKDWAFIDGACVCDGEKGGDGHAIVNAVHSCLTAFDPKTEDYSAVICNSTDKRLTYSFTVSGLEKAAASVYVWETKGNPKGRFDKNYFYLKKLETPVEKDGKYCFNITLAPFSLVTVSTLDIEASIYGLLQSKVLPLPYCDDFSYYDKERSFLAERGNAPLYTTDQGGAFEVTKVQGKHVLMQMITPDIKAEEWGYTPLPTTNFGDDRWFNYSVSADVTLCESEKPQENYAGIGLRFNQACKETSGYSLRIYESGQFKFLRNKETVKEGTVNAAAGKARKLKIAAKNGNILCYADGKQLCGFNDENPLCGGRAAFYSSYNRNSFENLEITPADGAFTYIRRYDDTDKEFSYVGDWEHKLMSSFTDYKRTVSVGKKVAKVTFCFKGEAFGIFGENKTEAVISLKVDGEYIFKKKTVSSSKSREMLCYVNKLKKCRHTAEIAVLSGELCVDGGEVSCDL